MNLKKRVEKLEKIYQTDILIIEWWLGNDENLIKLCGKTYIKDRKIIKEEIYDKDFSAFAE